MIAIVDYGVGNLFSLKSSFAAINAEACVTGDPAVISGADKIILPGVGAFRDAARKLADTGLDLVVRREALAGKPLMGICLGMQLLFDKSFEYGEYTGLGLLKGTIRPISERIPAEYKIPHMGWNRLIYKGTRHGLFRYLDDEAYVYFVHSYSAIDMCGSVIATAEYGCELTAAVAKDNITGCQFHPEKSGKTGLNILKAFCEGGY